MSDDPETLEGNVFRHGQERITQRLAVGFLLAGRYRIVGLLGTGGMGMVFRAVDEDLALTVAIKVLRPALSRDKLWIGRFKQELLLARQVSHANVVRIHDIGTDEDIAFLSMDFIPGRSVRELLAEEGPLAPERAARIARQVALALEAAHRAGVIHRDIKPSNVLIDESSAPFRTALTDFGIARSLTRSGQTLPNTSYYAAVGTPGYLSPEQERGDGLDGRSDLYSLGVLLYEMLTGSIPFPDRTDPGELVHQRDLASLSWPEDTPPRLRRLMLRLLAYDPARRPRNASQVAQELDLDRASSIRRKAQWGTAGAACLVLLAVLFGRPVLDLSRSGPQATPAPAVAEARHSVALLPLADETGRRDLSWIATGMPEMLTSSLAESPGLRVLDSPRVFRTMEDLKLPRGPLPEAEARRLAVLLDVDHLVSGQVRAAGGRLSIDLSLLSAGSPGVPAATLHAEADEKDTFLLVERLGGLLHQRLAVTAGTASEHAPSHSPVALAELARGSESLRRGDALAALPFLEKAVAADPRCAAAWMRLAEAREALGYQEPARAAARRAVENLKAADGRTAFQARALEARLLGNLGRAQEILGQLLARYPDDVETRTELAEAYGGQGTLDRATALLREVVQREPHHPRAWFLLGKYSILSGDSRKAVGEYLPRALVVQNELGNEQGRADVLNAFGVGYRNLGQVEKAAESYEAAAAIRRRIGDERGYATSQRNLATLETLRGHHAAARARLEEALPILIKLGDTAGLADLQNEFGALAEQRGDYEEALTRYRQSLRLRRELGNTLALAESFNNVGFAYYVLGRYDDALVYWNQGLDLARKSSNPGSVVLARQNLGLLELARGEWDAAAGSFLDALATSREIGMKEAIPVSLGHLGRLAQYQGRPGAALASYEQALVVLRELGDRRGLAEILLFRAETELEIGRTNAAAGHLRSAGEILSQGENREQRAELDRLLGELLLMKGETAAASEAFRRSVSAAEASQNVATLLSARLAAASVPGPAAEPLAGLEDLRVEAEVLGNARLRLRAAESVARAALAAGDPARAREVARAGLALAADCGGYAGSYRLHRLLAAALEREGRSGEAAAEHRLAAEEIARLGRNLPPEVLRFLERGAGAPKG